MWTSASRGKERMCTCHPRNLAEETVWRQVKQEPFTQDDWQDLHRTLEAFKRRVVRRHREKTLEGLPCRYSRLGRLCVLPRGHIGGHVVEGERFP